MKKIFTLWAFCLLLPNIAQAGLITGSGLVYGGKNAVDWYDFSTTDTGNVSISAEETNLNNSSRSWRNFDSVLFLFKDDGFLNYSDYIAYDDDGGYHFESLISIDLNAGDYLLAVASYGAKYSISNRRSDYQLSVKGGDYYTTDYTLNIKGDFISVAGAEIPVSVAEPLSILLFAVGLAGFAYSRKRKPLSRLNI